MIRILGGYWLLNTAALKLHGFVDLSESNATEKRHAVKGRGRNVRVYHVDFSWYRLYDLTSQ